MTGLVRKASLFAVCGLLAASAAMASVPSPANSVTPPCVALVGSVAGVTDPAGNFTITVRDISNFPINNSLVVVDFSGCSGLQICTTQPGLTSDCATQTVRGFTGPAGTITMAIAGHGNNGGDTPPYSAYNCGKIFADGVLLGNPSVQTYDHNGGGLGAADLSAWLGDFFGANNPSRSDYDCTGGLGAADLSAWLGVFFASTGGNGSVNNCPSTDTQCAVIP
jgi:hypothetical protein